MTLLNREFAIVKNLFRFGGILATKFVLVTNQQKDRFCILIFLHSHKIGDGFDSEQNMKFCNSVQLCPTIDPSSIFWQVHIISNKKKRKTFYSQGLEDHGKEG